MPQPPPVARATAVAAAYSTCGGGPPALAAWLQVRRRHTLLSLARRRYVVLTDDHVLLLDDIPFLHLPDCVVTPITSSNLIDLTPIHGVALRLYTDSEYQFMKWQSMLQAMAHMSLTKRYVVDLTTSQSIIGRGQYAVVRKGIPISAEHLLYHRQISNTTTSDNNNINNKSNGKSGGGGGNKRTKMKTAWKNWLNVGGAKANQRKRHQSIQPSSSSSSTVPPSHNDALAHTTPTTKRERARPVSSIDQPSSHQHHTHPGVQFSLDMQPPTNSNPNPNPTNSSKPPRVPRPPPPPRPSHLTEPWFMSAHLPTTTPTSGVRAASYEAAVDGGRFETHGQQQQQQGPPSLTHVNSWTPQSTNFLTQPQPQPHPHLHGHLHPFAHPQSHHHHHPHPHLHPSPPPPPTVDRHAISLPRYTFNQFNNRVSHEFPVDYPPPPPSFSSNPSPSSPLPPPSIHECASLNSTITSKAFDAIASKSFQRRVLSMPDDRDSVDIDPSPNLDPSLCAVPASKLDKWILTQPTLTASLLTSLALSRASISSSVVPPPPPPPPPPQSSTSMSSAMFVQKKPSLISIATSSSMNGGDDSVNNHSMSKKDAGGCIHNNENHHHHHHHHYHHDHVHAKPASLTSDRKASLSTASRSNYTQQSRSIDNGAIGHIQMKPIASQQHVPKVIYSSPFPPSNLPPPLRPHPTTTTNPTTTTINPNNNPTPTNTSAPASSKPTIVVVKTLPRKTGSHSDRASPAATARVASELMYGFSGLQHFALVRVLDVFPTATDIHIVMEYLSGGSLRQHVRRFGIMSETQARSIVIVVLKAVGYLHASGMAHWDISPCSVMFAGRNGSCPKLVGFGRAKPIDPDTGQVCVAHDVFGATGKTSGVSSGSGQQQQQQQKMCASSSSSPPELHMGKAKQYGAKVDMWQVGCMLFYCLFGHMPFTTNACGMSKHRNVVPVAHNKKNCRGRNGGDDMRMVDDTSDYEDSSDSDSDDDDDDKDDMQGQVDLIGFCRKRSAQRRAELFGQVEMRGGRIVSNEAKDMMMKLLCPNPRMRPNALQCLKQMRFVGGIAVR